jgi:hypothetical protein
LLGAIIIGSNRFFGSPISCATTELPNGISQNWVDTLCWITDKKFAPIQIVGNNHAKKSTLVFLVHFYSIFVLNFFRSFYQFTFETLILIAILSSIPGRLWSAVLGQSGYKLKMISTLIAATKQAVGCQRSTNIQQLAKHLQISRRYHRLHWSFDGVLSRRMAHFRLVLI